MIQNNRLKQASNDSGSSSGSFKELASRRTSVKRIVAEPVPRKKAEIFLPQPFRGGVFFQPNSIPPPPPPAPVGEVAPPLAAWAAPPPPPCEVPPTQSTMREAAKTRRASGVGVTVASSLISDPSVEHAFARVSAPEDPHRWVLYGYENEWFISNAKMSARLQASAPRCPTAPLRHRQAAGRRPPAV